MPLAYTFARIKQPEDNKDHARARVRARARNHGFFFEPQRHKEHKDDLWCLEEVALTLRKIIMFFHKSLSQSIILQKPLPNTTNHLCVLCVFVVFKKSDVDVFSGTGTGTVVCLDFDVMRKENGIAAILLE